MGSDPFFNEKGPDPSNTEYGTQYPHLLLSPIHLDLLTCSNDLWHSPRNTSRVGTALLDVATRLLRQLPLKTEAFEVPFDADLDALLPLASALCGGSMEVTAC